MSDNRTIVQRPRKRLFARVIFSQFFTSLIPASELIRGIKVVGIAVRAARGDPVGKGAGGEATSAG